MLVVRAPGKVTPERGWVSQEIAGYEHFAYLEPASNPFPGHSMSDSQTKTITLTGILAWIVGVILIILALATFAKNSMAAILFILAAALVLPPVMGFIATKWNLRLSRILRGVIAVVLIGIGIGASASGSPTKPAETESATNDTPAQEVSAEKSYQQVLEFKGSGAKKSEPFTITGDRFRIKYECAGSLNCQAFLYKVGGTLPQVIINTMAPVKDETVLYSSGEYYIDANMAAPFTMVVEDYR